VLTEINNFQDNTLDFVLIDGGPRNVCSNVVVKKIKLGGILVLDDANRFLPSDSKSPTSRNKIDGPRVSLSEEREPGLRWDDFLVKVHDWRCIWTSNGVKDTAIYIKTNL